MNSESTKKIGKKHAGVQQLLATRGRLPLKNWETSSLRVILHQRVHQPYVTRGINKKKSSKNLLPKSKGCLITYSHDYSVFMTFQFAKKPTFPNSNSTRNQVDEESLCGCATSKSLFIYFIHFIIQLQSGSTGWVGDGGGGKNLCSLKDGMRSWPCSCMGMWCIKKLTWGKHHSRPDHRMDIFLLIQKQMLCPLLVSYRVSNCHQHTLLFFLEDRVLPLL